MFHSAATGNILRSGVSLCLLFSILSWSPAEARSMHAPRPAPDFTLPDLDGRPVRLSSFRGHVVVLDFWASWCPPCIAQIPSMRRIADRYKSRGVVVLDINVLDEPNVVRRFVAEHGRFGSNVLLTADESVANAFNVDQFPTEILIDGAGRIVATISAGDSNPLTRLSAGINRLIPPSPHPETRK